MNKINKRKNFDGIPFYLFEIVDNKNKANEIAEKMRKAGYYARVISDDKFKVYVSTNPRWFFEWIGYDKQG